MGMDLDAINPIDPENGYWRSNIFGWSELWGYVCTISPTAELLGQRMWFNDGYGPDADQANAIAAEIRNHVASHGLPENPSRPPNRLDATNHQLLSILTGAENGPTVHFDNVDNYVAQNISDFADYCANSGGFEVW